MLSAAHREMLPTGYLMQTQETTTTPGSADENGDVVDLKKQKQGSTASRSP